MMRANVEEVALRANWVELQRAVANLQVREPLGPSGQEAGMLAAYVKRLAELEVEMDAAVHAPH